MFKPYWVNRIVFLAFFISIQSVVVYPQSTGGDPLKIVNTFYEGWQRLSMVSDFSGGEADAIECEINACAEGGDDCLNKSQIDLPREFEYLSDGGRISIASMRLGPYMAEFKMFMKNNNGRLTFSVPHEIAPVKGLARNGMPSYYCYVTEKKYTWGSGRNIKTISDTIWVKSSNNRISGIRNSMGGSGMVSYHNVYADNEQSEASSPISLKLQAAILLDKKMYDEAFNIYRALSYSDYTDFDAQYNLVLMEHRGLGCKWMGKNVREAEKTWFVEKNKANEGLLGTYTINLIAEGVKSNAKIKEMPYAENGVFSQTIARTMPPFSEGLMVVKGKNGKYGYADEHGIIQIPCQFECAYGFDGNGIASVMGDGKKYGFIDKKGRVVIPCKYDYAQARFTKGRAYCILDGKLVLIDNKGNILKTIDKYYTFLNTLKAEYALFRKGKGNWDVYDNDGNLIYSNYVNFTINYLNATIKLSSSDRKSTFICHYNW